VVGIGDPDAGALGIPNVPDMSVISEPKAIRK
jgi:hypothetical protein